MDGDAMNPATGLIAGYNQAETHAMVEEAHRLGKKVVVHARGAEGTLYAARAGVDVILHASWMDEEGLEAVVANGCRLCPTLSLVINDIEFTQPTDGCYPGFPDAHKRELEYYVDYLGFTTAQALRCATQVNGQFVRNAGQVCMLEAGRRADILIRGGRSPRRHFRVAG